MFNRNQISKSKRMIRSIRTVKETAGDLILKFVPPTRTFNEPEGVVRDDCEAAQECALLAVRVII